MTSGPCACLGADTLAAKQAIRKALRVAELADESHFTASIEWRTGTLHIPGHD